jgi:hypothetical protein
MIRIPLSNTTACALIDDADWPLVREYRWRESKGSKERTSYAICTRPDDEGVYCKMLALHRLLLRPKDGVVVDFIDGNRLNCQRANLRLRKKTGQPRPHFRKSIDAAKSPARCVRVRTRGSPGLPYEVRVGVKRGSYVGVYATLAEAIAARDAAERELYGEFGVFFRPNGER